VNRCPVASTRRKLVVSWFAPALKSIISFVIGMSSAGGSSVFIIVVVTFLIQNNNLLYSSTAYDVLLMMARMIAEIRLL
jgi:hypothetical protein